MYFFAPEVMKLTTFPKKETLTIEFKSDRRKNDKTNKEGLSDESLVQEVVGMANTEGGTIYLGIEDNGVVSGLVEKHKDPNGIAVLIANKTVPTVTVRTEMQFSDDKAVMVISVPRQNNVIATASGKILRRRKKLDGSPECVPMYPYEIPHRLSDLSQLDFSDQTFPDATLEDFDPNQVMRLRKIVQNRNGDKHLLELENVELEMALRLVKNVDGRPIPTVCGLLLIGKEESLNKFMPTMQTSFQVLKGTKVVVNESYSKPILEMLEILEEHFKAWNPEKEVEYGLFRLPVPEFSWSAFREGIVNAYAHRDYTLLGEVQVQITDEGLTIVNPGGFIEGITQDNLLTAPPIGRNPVLSDSLKRLGLAERTGRGIDRIYEGSIEFGRPWPDYSESTSRYVKLFIARAEADAQFTKLILDLRNQKDNPLSFSVMLVLSALKEERRMTLSMLEKETHFKKSRLQAILENAVEDGLVEEIGLSKTKEFMLSRRLYKESGKTKEYVRQARIERIKFEEMILKLAREQKGKIYKKDVMDLLNVTSVQAYSLLKKLVKEGKLEITSRGKYASYELKK